MSRFLGASSENICPIHYIVYSSSRSVSHWISVFSFKIHCLQMLQLFQTKKGSFFFIVTLVYSGCRAFPYIMHLYTLVTLFWCFIRKYLSHTLYCSQLVSVCFTLTLCFLLLNTLSTDVTVVSDKEGLNFFIVTLVYSGCIAFPYIMHCIHLSRVFGASSENICPIHYIVHSSSQSVSHWISVFSIKIHCLQMLQLYQTKKGLFFSSSHLYTVVA